MLVPRGLVPNHRSIPGQKPLSTTPPGTWEPLFRFARFATRPLERFLQIEAASGILLILIAAIALIWANSPWSGSYFALWHTTLGLRVGSLVFERSLEWLVNDCLMVVFFFLVGLEIRRELQHGELAEWRRAALPGAAALGGMLVPALLYLLIAGRGATRPGWGVPMATDIAFAVGVLTLLGNRVPAALRVLLLALAVIDDLGAIVVIALFYSSGVAFSGLLIAATGIATILVMQAIGIRQKVAYILPGLVVWGGTYAAGIHPTIAGVVVGMLTPVTVWLGPSGFVAQLRQSVGDLSRKSLDELPSPVLHRALQGVALAKREAISPAESLIASLHSWVAFAIMPVFALANAGVALDGLAFDTTTTTVVAGVGLGLVLGKPLGVLLACQLAQHLGVATRPKGITFRHLIVLGTAAGVGFTMALFVAQLAFTSPQLLGGAKLGVLIASAIAAVLSLVLGRQLLPQGHPDGIALSADEAESSTER